MISYLFSKEPVNNWMSSDSMILSRTLKNTFTGLVDGTHFVRECVPWAFVVICSREATSDEYETLRIMVTDACHTEQTAVNG